MIEKDVLRKSMLMKRATLTHVQKDIYSSNICTKLLGIIESKPNTVIHSYLPMGDEINVLPLLQTCLQKGYTVVSSKTMKRPQLMHLQLTDIDALEEGRFGTMYPAGDKEYIGEYDIIIVPGLAFDFDGNRIGYGAGYYDYFLNNHSKSLKLGVAYSFQMIDSVPAESHDIRLDKVIVPD